MPTNKQPPKVAVNGWFLDQPASGSGQYTIHLLDELERLWPGDIAVIRPDDAGARISGRLEKVWFEQVGVPRRAAQVGADLLHVPYFGAPAASPVPVVVTVHDLIQLVVPRLRGGPLNRTYNLLAAVGARRAAMLLADSEHSRQQAMQRLRLPPEKVRRVYLAADQRFRAGGRKEEEDSVRARFGLRSPFTLCMGPVDWRKNIALLIRAYARSGIEWPLVVTGEARSDRGSSFPDLQREVEEAGARERVRFLGWIDEAMKPALYRAAELFVYPSRYEGFGLSPLEALASGTPTLCSNATSLPEVVGDAAVLFDPEDETGLMVLLQRAAKDEALRARLRSDGPVQASRFSWEQTARETIDVYEEVLAGAGRETRPLQ